jgi:hypothetical protein
MLRLLGFEDLHVGMRESLMKTVMDSDVVGFARLSAMTTRCTFATSTPLRPVSGSASRTGSTPRA